MGNSFGFTSDEDVIFGVNPHIAHVWGSTSFKKGSSNLISGNASLGTSNPLNPKGVGLGFTIIHGTQWITFPIILYQSLAVKGKVQMSYKEEKHYNENLYNISNPQ